MATMEPHLSTAIVVITATQERQDLTSRLVPLVSTTLQVMQTAHV